MNEGQLNKQTQKYSFNQIPAECGVQAVTTEQSMQKKIPCGCYTAIIGLLVCY